MLKKKTIEDRVIEILKPWCVEMSEDIAEKITQEIKQSILDSLPKEREIINDKELWKMGFNVWE